MSNERLRTDWQGKLAKDLCVRAGINVEEYGSKTFGLEEVKIFAQLLAPQYGIAVHQGSANSGL